MKKYVAVFHSSHSSKQTKHSVVSEGRNGILRELWNSASYFQDKMLFFYIPSKFIQMTQNWNQLKFDNYALKMINHMLWHPFQPVFILNDAALANNPIWKVGKKRKSSLTFYPFFRTVTGKKELYVSTLTVNRILKVVKNHFCLEKNSIIYGIKYLFWFPES